MNDIFTGSQICGQYSDIRNDAFGTDDHRFILTRIDKEKLYDRPCLYSSNGKNLVTLGEWERHPENYDGYHTDNIHEMVEFLKSGGKLTPLIVNTQLSLYDGQHRLTAYSLIDTIMDIDVYKEI
ncbi:MAG: hypothetical protein ABF868_06200 [Sporolactobacillus sp.]